jgi:lysophospholipase L1-like esterase
VRAYGVVLERDGPGVVYDAVSMIGAYTGRLRAWNDAHMAAQLAHRDPDLLVMTYGGNDLRRVVANGLTTTAYEAEYDEVLDKVRSGKPDVPCLITSVIDHGRSGQQRVEPRHVEVIVAAQRSVAARHGCAFFDTYAAMGGGGSIHRWRNAKPRLAEPDLKHLNARGHDLMGENIYRALMAGYVAYRRENP